MPQISSIILLHYLDNEAIDGDETPYQFRINGVTILYENLKSEYKKVHRKIPKGWKYPRDSWMRVENGHVSIMIDVNNTECSGSFVAKVVVRREANAYEEVKTSVSFKFYRTMYLVKDLFSLFYKNNFTRTRI